MSALEPRWKSISNVPTLEDDHVHVWSLVLSEADEIAGEVESLLSRREREGAAKIINDVERDRYIAVHGILRKILAGYLEVQPVDIQLTYGLQGKPYVHQHDQGASLSFNLSHSDKLALFAFTYGRRIGVDLERIRDFADLDLIMAKTFTSVEIARSRSLMPTERVEAFYRAWTTKEAYLKARGEGILRDLRDIEVTIGADGQLCVTSDAQGNSTGEPWRCEPLAPANEYVGALVVEGMDWQLVLVDYATQSEINF